jgi:hypothetical protein
VVVRLLGVRVRVRLVNCREVFIPHSIPGYSDGLLVAYLGNIDMHRSNQTRPLMEQLKHAAEKYRCTILGIRHPSKLDQGGPLMYRGQGNMDIVGAARSALWVQKHPTHPETQSIMLHSKTNIGTPGRTVIFSRERGEFKWVGVTRLTEAISLNLSEFVAV